MIVSIGPALVKRRGAYSMQHRVQCAVETDMQFITIWSHIVMNCIWAAARQMNDADLPAGVLVTAASQ